MTARILIGAPSPVTSSTYTAHSLVPLPNLSTVTTSVSTSSESKSAGSTPTIRPKMDNKTLILGQTQLPQSSSSGSPSTSKVVTSLYVQPASNTAGDTSGPISLQPSTSTATASVYIPAVPAEPKGLGKETKGANIGGLIKSKTADFEKLAKSSVATPGVTTTSTTYSIAPKMRLRSQENIVLKQQFLLRQQQQHGEGGVSKSASSSAVKRSNSNKDSKDDGNSAGDGSRASSSGGQRSITRRRHIMGSASSSAILPDSSRTTSQPISVTVRSANVGQQAAGSQGTPPLASSPSRWKRSEIIASRQESRHQPSSTDPETFV
jgi:hypothetical protein